MSKGGPLSERVLVLAPNGRDGLLALSILNEAGLVGIACSSLGEVVERLHAGAGSMVIAEEAIFDADLRPIAGFLRAQAPWSDVPIILLTRRGGGPERDPATGRLGEILGNVTFLERPFHPATFASMAKAAARSRRRQYEARLRMEELVEAENRLETALKGGQLGAWAFDVETMQLRSSEAHRAHFGRAPAQSFSYEDLTNSVHPDDRARREEEFRRCLESLDDYRIEYRVIWPDGTTHWVDVRARGIRDANGEICHLVGVSSDITERKTSEQEREHLLAALAHERTALADLTQNLEQRVHSSTAELVAAVAAREKAHEQLLQSQKMEALGKLTGGIAHDFNNLLLAVIGNLEVLRKRLPADAGMRKLLDGALMGAERGATLTQRMLAFARQQDLKTAPTDLVRLVVGMRDLLARTLGAGVSLTIASAKGLPAAQVDSNQVELAILNLAINARDAMPDGGTIQIDIDQGHIAGPERPAPAPFLRIRVSDTGSGMDDSVLAKAVEPFYSTKPRGKGTGLGLSMVHGMAEQHGGLLELSSEPGHGTTATVWLPAAATPLLDDHRTAAETVARRPARILLVDDDVLIRTSTTFLLEELGHTVVDADCGKRALEILDKEGESIDMVITDHAMPEMTGVELAKALRDRHPDMPILLATGFADVPPGLAGISLLAKPYGLTRLQAAISDLLEIGRTETATQQR